MKHFFLISLLATLVVYTTSSFSPEKDVIFELYTRHNPNEPQILNLSNASTITQSNFNKTIPTRIVIHGWFTDGKMKKLFREAYFEKGNHDLNVICVNWAEGARTILYNVAKKRVNGVADQVAKLIEFLVQSGGMKYADLVVIGHSIGAHAAGIAGKQLSAGRIPKIVGLDPARVLYSFAETDNRLCSTDADYVEVIHTSALSFFQPMGTIDFYVNGGKSQPGCSFIRCSHQRAFELYAESIYSPEFSGFGCTEGLEALEKGNCTNNFYGFPLMGGEPGDHLLPKGIFFLNTNDKSPFAKREH